MFSCQSTTPPGEQCAIIYWNATLSRSFLLGLFINKPSTTRPKGRTMKPTLIVDLIDGECEVSSKKGECYVVRVDHNVESIIAHRSYSR